MRPAHQSEERALEQDDTQTIEISPPLPCGIASCGRLARHARIERDPETPALWRLLPICETHLASLTASAADITHSPHRPAPADE